MITLKGCTRIGIVSRLHGLTGSVVVKSEDFLLNEFEEEPVFLIIEGKPVPFFISENGIRSKGEDSWIVHFDDVDSQKQAAVLVGSEVYVSSESIADNDEKTLPSLEGFKVVDGERNIVGKVVAVLNYAGNMVLNIDFGARQVLLPLVDEYILETDTSAQTIFVNIPEELFVLN